jgi:hypothetical protein
MLAYISIGIALCNIAVGLLFGLAWLNLYDVIRHSSLLQEDFGTVVRRLIGSIGLFVIPAAVYLLEVKKSKNKCRALCFRMTRLLCGQFIIFSRGLNPSHTRC